MAQFPDVEHAVSAVQEILNDPNGSHIRAYQDSILLFVPRTQLLYLFPIECVELLDDNSMCIRILFRGLGNLTLFFDSDCCHQQGRSYLESPSCQRYTLPQTPRNGHFYQGNRELYQKDIPKARKQQIRVCLHSAAGRRAVGEP